MHLKNEQIYFNLELIKEFILNENGLCEWSKKNIHNFLWFIIYIQNIAE